MFKVLFVFAIVAVVYSVSLLPEYPHPDEPPMRKTLLTRLRLSRQYADESSPNIMKVFKTLKNDVQTTSKSLNFLDGAESAWSYRNLGLSGRI